MHFHFFTTDIFSESCNIIFNLLHKIACDGILNGYSYKIQHYKSF